HPDARPAAADLPQDRRLRTFRPRRARIQLGADRSRRSAARSRRPQGQGRVGARVRALRVVLPATAAVGVAVFAACAPLSMENPFAPAPTALRVDERNAGAPIALARGQTLVIVLEANVTTGYRWEVEKG